MRPIIPVIVGRLVDCVQCEQTMVVYPYAQSNNHPGFIHPECIEEWGRRHPDVQEGSDDQGA
jgi:hypothetical protein